MFTEKTLKTNILKETSLGELQYHCYKQPEERKYSSVPFSRQEKQGDFCPQVSLNSDVVSLLVPQPQCQKLGRHWKGLSIAQGLELDCRKMGKPVSPTLGGFSSCVSKCDRKHGLSSLTKAAGRILCFPGKEKQQEWSYLTYWRMGIPTERTCELEASGKEGEGIGLKSNNICQSAMSGKMQNSFTFLLLEFTCTWSSCKVFTLHNNRLPAFLRYLYININIRINKKLFAQAGAYGFQGYITSSTGCYRMSVQLASTFAC